jgi:hypothetical protein
MARGPVPLQCLNTVEKDQEAEEEIENLGLPYGHYPWREQDRCVVLIDGHGALAYDDEEQEGDEEIKTR